MKKLRKKLPDKAIGIIIGVSLLALGLFLLIKPGTSLITICTLFGIVALIAGIIRLINYLGDKKENNESPIDIISGVALLVCSFVLLLHPKFLLSILPFCIGIGILFYGVSSLLSVRKGGGILGKIIAVGVIIFGFSLVINPFKGATAVTSMIGFGLFSWGIIKIIFEFIFNKPSIIPVDSDDDGYKEVDFKDI